MKFTSTVANSVIAVNGNKEKNCCYFFEEARCGLG